LHFFLCVIEWKHFSRVEAEMLLDIAMLVVDVQDTACLLVVHVRHCDKISFWLKKFSFQDTILILTSICLKFLRIFDNKDCIELYKQYGCHAFDFLIGCEL
jgi:hypothetical protein